MLPTNLETLPERVIWARKERNLSQTELAKIIADKMGLPLSQQSIEKLENGHVKKPRYLHEAAVVLNVPYSWLLDNDPEDNSLISKIRQLNKGNTDTIETMVDAYLAKQSQD